MTKSQIKEARAELRDLTKQLRDRGVTHLAYPEEHIDQFTPATLRSCIVWAKNIIRLA